MSPLIRGFWHICQMNHWKTVVREQGALLDTSGLREATDSIQAGVVGSEALDHLGPKVTVGFRDTNIGLFEFPTLALLWHACQDGEGVVWYIHTKGVVDPRGEGHAQQEQWRRALEWGTIGRWKQCLAALDTHDAAGPLWSGYIFGGNFWWATAAYVRTLPQPDTQKAWLRRKDARLFAEKWINCHRPPVRACNIPTLPADPHFQVVLT